MPPSRSSAIWRRGCASRGTRWPISGPDSDDRVDYPDYGYMLADAIAHGEAERGIALCGSGIGISIAVNRNPAARCALVSEPLSASLAREHNDANAIAMGARLTGIDMAKACVEAFLTTDFAGASDPDSRHTGRVEKLAHPPLTPLKTGVHCMTATLEAEAPIRSAGFFTERLESADPAVYAAIRGELHRQQTKIELIASENIASAAVLEATGSVFTNKYAEGYPGKRYYGGCEYADVVENLAIERAKELFGCDFANVQPNSGSQMNQAVFLALLTPGDTFMGLDLNAGGHLTHGSPVNMSGKWFKPIPYGVRAEDELLDMDAVRATAREHKPKLIIAGGTAYSRTWDFAAFREIADEVGAILMVDMSHFSGLVAGGAHPSPFPHAARRDHDHAQVAARAALGRDPDQRRGDRQEGQLGGVPGNAGRSAGPRHRRQGRGIRRGELRRNSSAYAHQIVANSRALAASLADNGLRIVSGGTDNHLMLVDLTAKNVTGKAAEKGLDRAWLTCNKNGVPFDTRSPFVTSGIRLGTPAGTTRGFREAEFRQIGALIAEVVDGLSHNGDEGDAQVEARVRGRVEELCNAFPIYPEM